MSAYTGDRFNFGPGWPFWHFVHGILHDLQPFAFLLVVSCNVSNLNMVPEDDAQPFLYNLLKKYAKLPFWIWLITKTRITNFIIQNKYPGSAVFLASFMFCSFYCRKEHQNCTFCWISIGIHICIPWFRWSDIKTWCWEGVCGLHHKEKTQYWSIIVNVHFYDWRHFKLIGKSGSLFCWPSCLLSWNYILGYLSILFLL